MGGELEVDRSGRGTLAGLVTGIIGQRTWEPAIGVGSFITMNFGEPQKSPSGGVFGEFHLWVYGAHWVVRHDGTVAATSDDTHAVMAEAVARFEGRVVTDAHVSIDNLALRVAFGGDLTLEAAPASDPEMEHWMTFLPDGSVVVAGPGRELTLEPA